MKQFNFEVYINFYWNNKNESSFYFKLLGFFFNQSKIKTLNRASNFAFLPGLYTIKSISYSITLNENIIFEKNIVIFRYIFLQIK